MMDTDVLVRANLMSWYDYPAPCGTQQKGESSWNSGALVLEPSTKIFNKMMEQLPYVKRYNPIDNYTTDPRNGGNSDQDFISAFFLKESVKEGKMRCVMPAEAAILSSAMKDDSSWDYYNKFMPSIYQVIHFSASPHKPWKYIETSHKFSCTIYLEWFDSVDGIEEFYDRIPPMRGDREEVCAQVPP